MDLPRLEGFSKYWDRVPPLAESAAAIATRLGVERKSHTKSFDGATEERPPEMTDEQYSELASIFGEPAIVSKGEMDVTVS